jgi:hypothetical protein
MHVSFNVTIRRIDSLMPSFSSEYPTVEQECARALGSEVVDSVLTELAGQIGTYGFTVNSANTVLDNAGLELYYSAEWRAHLNVTTTVSFDYGSDFTDSNAETLGLKVAQDLIGVSLVIQDTIHGGNVTAPIGAGNSYTPEDGVNLISYDVTKTTISSPEPSPIALPTGTIYLIIIVVVLLAVPFMFDSFGSEPKKKRSR